MVKTILMPWAIIVNCALAKRTEQQRPMKNSLSDDFVFQIKGFMRWARAYGAK